MRLTQYTDYSLRVLIYLALRRDRRSTITEIAQAYGISRNHLTKVVHQLQVKGYLATVRGKGGGIWLDKSPEAINLGHVVQGMEPDFALAECFGSRNRCVITPTCQLRYVLDDARKAFLDTLEQYTLADITGGQSRLALAGELGIAKELVS